MELKATTESVTGSSSMEAAELRPEWPSRGKASSSTMHPIATDSCSGLVVQVAGWRSRTVEGRKGKNSAQLGGNSSSTGQPPWRFSVLGGRVCC
jgi:hypothetical protein